MQVTNESADCLLRLPMWLGMEEQQTQVISAVLEAI
jgi:hypothetical protein